MIPFTACGDLFNHGLKLYDQERQRSSHGANGLLATDGCKELIWYSKGATKVLKSISCASVPVDAVICDFAGSNAGGGSQHNSAIAILLTSDLLQLHLLNGETFDIHLPLPMVKIFASSTGLLLQRKPSSLEFQSDQINAQSNRSLQLFAVGTDVGNFNAKLWLDEVSDESNTAFLRGMESPYFDKRSSGSLMSPAFSDSHSPTHFQQSSVESPNFFSLAHPTAPVRPVRLHGNSSYVDHDIDGDGNSGFSRNHTGLHSSTNVNTVDHDKSGFMSSPGFNKKRAGSRNFSEQSLLAVEGNLLCTLKRDTSSVVLWHISHSTVSSHDERGLIHPCTVDDGEHILNSSTVSQATSTTIANTSVLEGRYLPQRDLANSSPSFLSLSVNNTRSSIGSSHSRPDSMGSHTLSMNVSHSTGASSAGGMITSALMPYESLSGPSISLERERERERDRERGSKRGGAVNHTTPGAVMSTFPSSSPVPLFVFSPLPLAVELLAPTRQSNRLANQRRAATLRDVSMLSVVLPTRARTSGTPSPQSTPFSPPSAFSSMGKDSVSMADLTVDTTVLRHSSEYLHEGHTGTGPGPSNRSHSHTQQHTQEMEGEGDGEGYDDHHASALPSDTRMAALCTLDLRSLPGVWGTVLSNGTIDLEKELKVTISGGEDALGGLQVHFLLPSEGAHAHFRIVTNHAPSSSGAGCTVPPVTLQLLPQSAAAGGICSIAHIQIPLSLLHQASETIVAAGFAGLGLGRCRGSSNMLPVTLLMHAQTPSSIPSNSMLHDSMESMKDLITCPRVTVLIGGHPVGGERALTWTDDLEGFDLSLDGSDGPQNTSCLSLHSLGVSDSHMLCVGQSTGQEIVGSFVLSGPACLFGAGDADSVNCVVAQAIITTLRTYRVVKGAGSGGPLGVPNQCSGDGVELDCDFLVAEILAVMLLAQAEFGALQVLRLLLSTAFGMSLEDLPPLTQQRSSCEMLTRAASFHDLSSSFVCHKESDTRQGDAGSSVGYPLRAVLYDILHSTLQDVLLRGQDMHGDDGLGVRILCNALRSVSLALSSSLHIETLGVGQCSTPTSAMSRAEQRDCAVQYSRYYSAIINTSRGEEKVEEDQDSLGFLVSQNGLVPFTLFTCSSASTPTATVPHVLDWVIEFVQCVAQTGDCSSIPAFYTPEGLIESSMSQMKDDHIDIIHPFPAIAFTRQFFQYLSLAIHDVKNADSDESKNQEPEAVANAFIKASKGDLSCLLLLPPPLRTFIELALRQCKEAPYYPLETGDPKGSIRQPWPTSVLKLIGRNDLSAHLIHLDTSHKECSDGKKRGTAGRDNTNPQSNIQSDKSASLDGLSEIEEEACRLRFSEDDRVHEVCRLLRSSGGVYLRLEKAPEVSDLDYRHKLQMRLLVLCRRSLACPVGRGALTLGSLTPLMAEALPCPPLSLSGRIPPNNTPLLLHTSTAPKDLSLWPQFHNGVAAGLRVSYLQDLGSRIPSLKLPQSEATRGQRVGSASTVTRNWIIYNRTATADDSSFHAGVLLALGLQGHLRVLSVTDICDYLTQGNQPTTIALLVGLPSSRLGTADPLLSKTLCLHVPSLLPPQHWDIEILPQVQTAALIGLGLLYCNSGHRLMTEFLLAELGRRPTADRDRGDCREAVSFAAAWALGVVLLGRGKAKRSGNSIGVDKSSIGGMGGLTDLCIEDRLYQHLEGGKRPPDSNLFPYAGAPQGDGHAAGGRSSRVMEGDKLNTGITGPGAAVALGLIYIRSGNEEICRRLALPQTAFALDSVRPDLLLYRAVSRCLVLWDAVEPTSAWIDSQVPDAIIRSLFPSQIIPGDHIPGKRREARGKVDLDPRSALAVYLNIITGYCWGMGLVYAGTADEVARDTLLEKLKMLQGFRENKLPFPLPFAPNAKTLRPLIEGCIGSVSLALSCVMAGTGDLICLRILRSLRWKVDDVTYGTHLSLAMAIGILFLSGGSASLRRDPMSCASLLMATAPRFPIRTVDNQYHLQALRHLYVLAVEARALQIVDVDQGSAVSVDIEIVLLSGEILLKKAPCLLPELVTVQSVRLPSSSTLYYPASMVITTLEGNSQQCVSGIPHPLYVKRRPSPSLFLHAPQRALVTVNREVQGPQRALVTADREVQGPPPDSTDLFTESLRGMLAGGKPGGSSRLHPEGGEVESQIGLEYLLQAAAEHFEFNEDSSMVGCCDKENLMNASIPLEQEGTAVKSNVYATLSDIATTLSTVGPLTKRIFLQAMIESNSA